MDDSLYGPFKSTLPPIGYQAQIAGMDDSVESMMKKKKAKQAEEERQRNMITLYGGGKMPGLAPDGRYGNNFPDSLVSNLNADGRYGEGTP